MDISMEELESKNTYTCNICKEKFESKSGMMKHRKKEHIEQVKTCWNFESNSCPFAESLCWFRHTNSELPQEKYDCKFCGEVFKTKNELQIHKKIKHSKLSPSVQMTNLGMDKKSAGLGTSIMKMKNSIKIKQIQKYENEKS